MEFTISGPIDQLLSRHRLISLIQSNARTELWPVHSE